MAYRDGLQLWLPPSCWVCTVEEVSFLSLFIPNRYAARFFLGHCVGVWTNSCRTHCHTSEFIVHEERIVVLVVGVKMLAGWPMGVS